MGSGESRRCWNKKGPWFIRGLLDCVYLVLETNAISTICLVYPDCIKVVL